MYHKNLIKIINNVRLERSLLVELQTTCTGGLPNFVLNFLPNENSLRTNAFPAATLTTYFVSEYKFETLNFI